MAMYKFWQEFIDNLPHDVAPKSLRRRLNEQDIDDFMRAAEARPRRSRRMTEDLRILLKYKNPWRWKRMQSDIRWARKTISKAGYDPEEFRWLL